MDYAANPRRGFVCHALSHTLRDALPTHQVRNSTIFPSTLQLNPSWPHSDRARSADRVEVIDYFGRDEILWPICLTCAELLAARVPGSGRRTHSAFRSTHRRKIHVM